MSIKVCLAGATGRMGGTIIMEVKNFPDISIIAGFCRKVTGDLNFPVYAGKDEIKKACRNVDIWVDFTTPNAFLSNLPLVSKEGVDLVVGTTGWYNEIESVNRIVKENGVSAIFAPNFSSLVNMQFYFAKISSKALEPLGYTFGIVEEHHEGKIDVPSGTADRLADIIIQHTSYEKKKMRKWGIDKKLPTQLDIASLRLKGTVGDHELRIRGENARLDIKSMIYNRKEFANGALFSVKWLSMNRVSGKTFDFYRDVLSLK